MEAALTFAMTMELELELELGLEFRCKRHRNEPGCVVGEHEHPVLDAMHRNFGTKNIYMVMINLRFFGEWHDV